ncbi:hypothetical protein [Actinoalloteichus sp. GBA129-24]|uniref:hypothetical protein n=1 Tax=Actinoalloteichus sp. GBA129-24 TaxID=1612551 RepID=UPI001E3F36EB|nr:hypothetical protein [Actinoalloteichus sp. GBA129-24]
MIRRNEEDTWNEEDAEEVEDAEDAEEVGEVGEVGEVEEGGEGGVGGVGPAAATGVMPSPHTASTVVSAVVVFFNTSPTITYRTLRRHPVTHRRTTPARDVGHVEHHIGNSRSTWVSADHDGRFEKPS